MSRVPSTPATSTTSKNKSGKPGIPSLPETKINSQVSGLNTHQHKNRKKIS
jgi:hypothetical protein